MFFLYFKGIFFSILFFIFSTRVFLYKNYNNFLTGEDLNWDTFFFFFIVEEKIDLLC
jgi:hypothetical protein